VHRRQAINPCRGAARLQEIAPMESAIEYFVALTSPVIGASHFFHAKDWSETFRQLHSCGRPGAFANGAMSLVPGAAIVAAHGAWTWPGGMLTGFGWLLVIKGLICFLAPAQALRSMERGARSPHSFKIGGVLIFALGLWACYCTWQGRT
jgi:hypothetical protein